MSMQTDKQQKSNMMGIPNAEPRTLTKRKVWCKKDINTMVDDKEL